MNPVFPVSIVSLHPAQTRLAKAPNELCFSPGETYPYIAVVHTVNSRRVGLTKCWKSSLYSTYSTKSTGYLKASRQWYGTNPQNPDGHQRLDYGRARLHARSEGKGFRWNTPRTALPISGGLLDFHWISSMRNLALVRMVFPRQTLTGS
jgi:hypothetical protein